MIANLQYAIDYRPYILKNGRSKGTSKSNKLGKTEKQVDIKNIYKNNDMNTKDQNPHLLKANDSKVVDYMRTVANSVNDMKFGVKTLSRSLSRFETDYYKDDDVIKGFIEEDIEEFTRTLNNNFRGTLSTEISSGNIDNYLGKIQQSIATNMDLINNLGIDIEGGKAVTNSKGIDYDKIKENVDSYVDLLSEINDTTNDMLSKSIYEQVKFNDMKLVVNYNFNYDTEKTFELFNEGIVLDVAV